MDRHARAAGEAMVGEERAREGAGAIGVRAFDGERLRARRRDEERRLGGGGADAAEPPAERAAQVEDAEMEPRRRLDEHGAGAGHGAGRSRSRGADRM